MGSVKMGIGFGLWHQGMPDAATLFEYIDKAEAWGIDSVWLSDHLMGPRPEVAIVPMMAAIAARTQRLKFGPSVMMLPLRHPIAVAREVATLDFLSGGRVIMAVGLGADEHEAELDEHREQDEERRRHPRTAGRGHDPGHEEHRHARREDRRRDAQQLPAACAARHEPRHHDAGGADREVRHRQPPRPCPG